MLSTRLALLAISKRPGACGRNHYITGRFG